VFSNTAAGLPAELGPDGQMAAPPTVVRGGWTPANGASARQHSGEAGSHGKVQPSEGL
jgi:hypothetical protein